MAEGDIGGVLASLEFEPGYGGEPRIYHIAGDVYAVVNYQVPLQLWIRTLTISDDGLTLALTGSSLQIDDTRGSKEVLLHVAGDVYAIFYQGIDDDGWIKTFTIADDGTLGAGIIASREFDTVLGAHPDAIHIAGNVFAVAYQGALEDGWLKTVTISDDGATITLTGSSLEFDPGQGYYPTILHRAGTVYAIFYQGVDNDGWLRTVNIADDGTITSPVLASLEWTPEVALHAVSPRAIHIGGDVFAVSAQSVIETLSISADGLTLSEIHKQSGPVVTGVPACFIPVSGDAYALIYEAGGTAGQVYTKEIPSDGVMPIPSIDEFNFHTPGEEPWCIHVAGNTYAIVCRDTASVGMLYTVDIETVIAPTSVGGMNPALMEVLGY